LETAEIGTRTDIGALRVRLMATKNLPAGGYPDRTAAGEYAEGVILDLDAWLAIPR
jgi:2-methylfumaryl-CoA hydratase